MPVDRRSFLRTLAGAGLGAYLGSRATEGWSQRDSRPNILLVMTDQHRLDATGAHGNAVIRTPSMDRLAREGTRFERYYIAAFPCSPSRASILTGLHPQSHGVITNGVKLEESIPTFATELSGAGYRTTWMGKWHLGGPKAFVPATEDQLPSVGKLEGKPPGEKMPQNGFRDGVSPSADYVDYLRELGLEEPRPGQKVRGGHHTVIEDGRSVIPQEHFVETFLTDNAVKYLQERAADGQRFCLCVSYEGPHRPMTPPAPWDAMYDPAEVPRPETINDPMTDAPRTHREFRWRMHGIDLAAERERLKRQLVFEGEMWDLLDRPAWTEREYRELTAHYYGYISYIDGQIGRLLGALDSQGLAEDTLVIYTTDHGEFMGGHGCIFKAMMMYDDLMRVPLIVRHPRVRAGVASQALCSSVDLMPTLLHFAGVDVPAGVQGSSIRPVLQGGSDRLHAAVYTSFPGPGVQMRCVRTEDYKYSLNAKPRQANELRDMKADPLEMRNLAGRAEWEQTEKKMQELVFGFMDEIEDPWRKQIRLSVNMPLLTAILFEFEEEHEVGYWQLFRGLSKVGVREGRLVGHIDCPGYMIAQLDEPVQGDDYPALEITMAATAGEAAQLYWATEAEPRMREALSVRFAIESDGEMHTYRIDLGEHEHWRGQIITSIRLNPVRRRAGQQEELSADFEIDRIGPAQ